MATTAWKLCTRAAGGWTNQNNITADDGAVASQSVGAGGQTAILVADSFGFTDSDIPVGATIDGIEVRIEASKFPYAMSVVLASLRKTLGTNVGDNKSASITLTNTLAKYTLGGAADLWGTTWTDAEVKQTSFGFAYRTQNNDGKYSVDANVDCVEARVYYTAAASVPTVSSVSPSSGPTAGGTAITITGTDFTGATGVTIGGVAATSLSVASATTITCVTPAGTAGAKDVVVTTSAGSGTLSSGYTYVPGVDIVGELLMETGVPLREESDEELLIEGTGGLDEAANRVVDQWFGMEF